MNIETASAPGSAALSAVDAPPRVTSVRVFIRPDEISNADPGPMLDSTDPESVVRLKTFGRSWHYISLEVVAEIVVCDRVQRIGCSLHGIESDADRKYLTVEAQQEYDELAVILAALGIQLEVPFGLAEWVERC